MEYYWCENLQLVKKRVEEYAAEFNFGDHNALSLIEMDFWQEFRKKLKRKTVGGSKPKYLTRLYRKGIESFTTGKFVITSP